jgi:DNA-binding transcriptional ArsR family regulator
MVREERIDWDVVFKALANTTRRELLRYLTRTRTATISDVKRALLDVETSSNDGDLLQVDIELTHVHLPTLTDAELVTVDTERETIELSPGAERLLKEASISQLLETDRPTPRDSAGRRTVADN